MLILKVNIKFYNFMKTRQFIIFGIWKFSCFISPLCSANVALVGSDSHRFMWKWTKIEEKEKKRQKFLILIVVVVRANELDSLQVSFYFFHFFHFFILFYILLFSLIVTLSNTFCYNYRKQKEEIENTQNVFDCPKQTYTTYRRIYPSKK